jgi:hypothetical protein
MGMTSEEDLWVYSYDKTLRIVLVVLSVMLSLAVLFLITWGDVNMPLFGYLILIGLAILLFWIAFYKPVVIEIDRKQGTIKKRYLLSYFRRDKFYSLSSFNTVKIIVTKGHRTPTMYSVQLYGPTSAAVPYLEQNVFADDVLTILHISDEEKAKGYARDLADFLNFPVFMVSPNGFLSTTEAPLDR